MTTYYSSVVNLFVHQYDYEEKILGDTVPGNDTIFLSDILSDSVRLIEIEAGRKKREDFMAGGGA